MPVSPTELDAGDLDLRIVRYESDFNYSAINNAGAAAAAGEFLLFLNDDTEVQSPDWIERLLGLVQQPGTGVAGAKLVYPGGAVQMGGVLLTDNGHGARLIGCGLAAEDPGYHGGLRGHIVSGAATTAASHGNGPSCLAPGTPHYSLSTPRLEEFEIRVPAGASPPERLGQRTGRTRT